MAVFWIIFTKVCGVPIPVAARSKAWVCGCSLAGIAGSNSAGSIDVYLLLTLNLLTTTIVAPPSNASKWQMGFNSVFKGLMLCDVMQRSLRRADHWSRVVLLSVVWAMNLLKMAWACYGCCFNKKYAASVSWSSSSEVHVPGRHIAIAIVFYMRRLMFLVVSIDFASCHPSAA